MNNANNTVGAVWGSRRDRELFEEHIRRNVGPISSIQHDINLSGLHATFYHVQDSQPGGWSTIISYFLSDRGVYNSRSGELEFYEFCITVPPGWSAELQREPDAKYGWPVVWMDLIQRMLVYNNDYMTFGHTVGASEVGKSFNIHTDFYGFLLTRPYGLSENFWSIELSSDRNVQLISLLPLYQSELQGALECGSQWLLERIHGAGVKSRVEPGRRAVA